MKVFLSWSGESSRRVAEELKEWLQSVIQSLEPWFSPEDIEKGSRWSPEIAKELSASKAGIVCVTPDNQSSPWLNFEAGAISNAAGAARVCTLVIGMKATDVKGPLSQFQATIVERTDARKLVGTLNRLLEKDALSESKLDRAFDAFWPSLEVKLKEIEMQISKIRPAPNPRPEREMIEEILGIVRDLGSDRITANYFGNAVSYPHQTIGMPASGMIWDSGYGNAAGANWYGAKPVTISSDSLEKLLHEIAERSHRSADPRVSDREPERANDDEEESNNSNSG